MLDKLTAAESRYEQLMAEMADPAVQADTAKFRTHSKELAEMQPLVEHFRDYKEVAAQFAATEELVKDPDMRELAQEELKSLQARRDTLARRAEGPAHPEGSERREERRARNPRRRRRRRSGALRLRSLPDVLALRGAAGVASRSPEPRATPASAARRKSRRSSRARACTAG